MILPDAKNEWPRHLSAWAISVKPAPNARAVGLIENSASVSDDKQVAGILRIDLPI